MTKIKFGTTSSSYLSDKFGEPQKETQGTNDGGFYSDKCGKRGAPVQVWGYTNLHTGLVSNKMESSTFVISADNKVCNSIRQKARGGF